MTINDLEHKLAASRQHLAEYMSTPYQLLVPDIDLPLVNSQIAILENILALYPNRAEQIDPLATRSPPTTAMAT